MNNSMSYDKFNRQHLVIAIIALILSIGLHIALFITLPGLKFSMPIIAAERNANILTSHIRLNDVNLKDNNVKSDSGKNGIAGPENIGKLLNIENTEHELARLPDETVTAPPLIVQDDIAGEKTPIAKPDITEVREHWEPRQDIIAIATKLAASEVSTLPRYNIPMIERIVNAPDILDPVDRDVPAENVVKQASKIMSSVAATITRPVAIKSSVTAGEGVNALSEQEKKLNIGTVPKKKSEEIIAENPAEVTGSKPIENFLKATITTYSSIRDYRYGYFRIEINRTGKEILPVMSKDLLFLQDCSASMSEQRLYFCRQVLKKSLSCLIPGDRFNVVSFKDTNSLCFPSSVVVNDATKQTARNFIGRMRTGGNTDIYDSMRQVVENGKDNERPVIAVLISDGIPTSGITDSTRIIRNITKMNNGKVSIFSYGTTIKANSYLLGLISYCNRGDARIVSDGRWGIPDDISALVYSISRPVLTDIRFYLTDKNIEMYPEQTSNLYLDKTLVLYGRYPRGTENMLFQVFGKSLSKRCDMIFNLPLDASSSSRDKSIRKEWALQKLYTLLGRYARNEDRDILVHIRHTARTYHLSVPYKEWFKSVLKE